MSMLTMTGQLINVFESPKGTNKQGDEYGGTPRIQLLGSSPLPNGDTRMELVTLGVEDERPYKAVVGQAIRVPVGVFASKSAAVFFVPKGSRLALVSDPSARTEGGSEARASGA